MNRKYIVSEDQLRDHRLLSFTEGEGVPMLACKHRIIEINFETHDKVVRLCERAIMQKEMVAERNKSLLFAEWLDIEGIRNDKHEWKWCGDNWKGRYTTKEMYVKFESEYKKTIN